MAKDTNFLIPSFLSLVISGYAFTFPIDKQKGIIKATIGKSIPEDKRPPSYSQTCRRTNKLDININSSIDDNDDVVIIAVDSTGIKLTNRGQWMQDKWNSRQKRRAI